MDILALILAVGLGFGASCWIFGKELDRSNNIGDSTGSRFHYRANVRFTVQKDRLSGSDRDSFSSNYAIRLEEPEADIKGISRVRRMTEKERKEYGERYKKSSSVNNSAKADLSGIFSPLEDL